MCTATPKVAKTPESPEPVKTTDEEIVQARQTARNAAVRRYGLRGTDLTGGLVSDTGMNKTLGA